MKKEYTINPIGIVHNARTEVEDDNWGNVISTIELDSNRFSEEALKELDTFSHLEVVFYMDRVRIENIYTGSRHPRNRKDWPSAGIFAQRVKSRPNLLGISRCRLLDVQGLTLTVEGLDAINDTPVIDIKPYLKEFGPRGPVMQPEWATELMKNYF
jgi:tRNA-Thr(GGU) m(6)t(6)A37 methyltransferase TsaA